MDFEDNNIDESIRQSVSDMKEFTQMWKFFMHIIDFPDYIFKEALTKYSIKKTICTEQTFDENGVSGKKETHVIWDFYNHSRRYLWYDTTDKTLKVSIELLDKLRAYSVEKRNNIKTLLFNRAYEFELPE